MITLTRITNFGMEQCLLTLDRDNKDLLHYIKVDLFLLSHPRWLGLQGSIRSKKKKSRKWFGHSFAIVLSGVVYSGTEL